LSLFDKEPKVSVVILNYNKPTFTLACVDSVLHSDYANFEVIVVDNCSQFSSFVFLKEKIVKSQVMLIRTESNRGYAGGNNVGILHSTGKYILLLNDDVIVNGSLISGLVAIAKKNSSIGMIGPAVYQYNSGKLWGYSPGILKEDTDVVNVPLVVGAAVMISRTALNKIGLLDENYFMYNEDWDWCFRFRDAGFRTVCAPKLSAWHNIKENKIFTRHTAYFYHRNFFLFAARHCKTNGQVLNFLFKQLVWHKGWKLPFSYPFAALSKRQPEVIRSYFMGIIDGLAFLLKARFSPSTNTGKESLPKYEDEVMRRRSKELKDVIF
jgi:GT2 family glycosyltransferase